MFDAGGIVKIYMQIDSTGGTHASKHRKHKRQN